MFCSNCGKKLNTNTKFCGNCGISNEPSSNSHTRPTLIEASASPFFYSEDWTQRKVFVIAAFPYFDIMADQENLYLIQLDKYYWSTFGTVGGLLVLSLLGAIIGYYLGSSNDKKKRALQRSSWINTSHQLISKAYEKNLFLKIPIHDVRKLISFEKHKLIIQHDGKEIILAKKLDEVNRLNQFLNDYVL